MSEIYTIERGYAVSIINDDRTGLTDQEDDQLDAWVERVHNNRPGYFTLDDSEPDFQQDEITGLMADCVTVEFHIIKSATQAT